LPPPRRVPPRRVHNDGSFLRPHLEGQTNSARELGASAISSELAALFGAIHERQRQAAGLGRARYCEQGREERNRDRDETELPAV
jgi:hypothetical protein